MKNVIRLSCLFISLLLIVACGSNGTGSEQNEGNSNNANPDNEVEQASDEKLRLGDTGTLKDTIGEYEVTPTAFEITKSVDGDVPSHADTHDDDFIIVDITIKNIGDSALEGPDITRSGVVLADDNDLKSDNRWDYEWGDQITSEIQPGEEVDGQLVFERPPSEYYELIFGYGLSSVSSQATWYFEPDEAK